jgi:two-component sensor histidine kinase
VVRRILAPYAGADRLDIRGPRVLLVPKVALAITAAVQELSTNAAKYGGFSVASGKLTVSWTNAESGSVRLLWIETDGPRVQEPSRQGFGTKMIAGIFAAEEAWSVDLAFEPSGLRCTMHFWPRGHDEAGSRRPQA